MLISLHSVNTSQIHTYLLTEWLTQANMPRCLKQNKKKVREAFVAAFCRPEHLKSLHSTTIATEPINH